MALALCTSALVRTLAKDASDWPDEMLTPMIAEASALVERHLDRATLAGAFTQTIVCEPNQTVFSLRNYPVSALTTVQVKYFNDDPEDVDEDAYYVDGHHLIFTSVAPFTCARNDRPRLIVTGTGGMAATTTAFIAAFPDIANGVARFIALVYRRSLNLHVRGQSAEGINMSYEPLTLPQWLLDAIATHRRLS